MTPDPSRFRIELAGQAHAHINRLVTRAEQRGLRPLLLEVLRHLMENLETRPRDWGDPYINYHTLNAVGYGRTIVRAGLRVGYAVHETEPVVWVTAVKVLFGSPFE